MISISRLLAKQIRNVFRRALNLSPQALNQPVKFSAGSFGLKVTSSFGDFAAEYEDRTPRPKKFSLIAPMQLLKEVEGTTTDEVRLTTESDQIVAHWQEGPVPKTWSTAPLEDSDRTETPAYPEKVTTNGIKLLESLDTAMLAVDPSSSRYALGCIQLRGAMGDITATDGRQVIRERGYQFGCDREVLVRASKVFEAKELRQHQQVDVGLTEKHFAIVVGPWTFWLAVETEARFPRVDDVIPRTNSAATVLEVSESDARFLKANLAHLPGASDPYRPVTLDLNGVVAFRAQESSNQPITELTLSNSKATGTHLFTATNRLYLERALDLGFRKFHFFGDEAPVSCIGDRRAFVWAVLGKENTVARNHAKTNCISSPFQTTSTRTKTMPRRSASPSVPAPAPTPVQVTPAVNQEPMKRRRRINKTAGTIVEQAIALRTTLRDVLSQTAELLRAIKHQRKRDRMLRSTLASLKQLQAA